MVPEDTKSNRTGPNIEVQCKINTGAGSNFVPISVFRRLHVAMFFATEKLMRSFDSVWAALTAYEGASIKKHGVRGTKDIWNNKWEFIFHTVDAQGPILLGLRTLRQMGIFSYLSHCLHRLLTFASAN